MLEFAVLWINRTSARRIQMHSTARKNPNYGRGVYELKADRRPKKKGPALTTLLLDAFRSKDYTPPKLPKVAMQILQLSQEQGVEMRQILALLEKDSLLAGSVLRVARSPAYCGVAGIATLHQALVRLGLKRLTEIVLQASMTMEVFRAPGYEGPMEALGLHCTVTAHLTRFICSASSIPNDHAFLCGLMHDVGISAAMMLLAHRKKRRLSFSRMWPAVEQAHQEAGAIVARVWDLPEEVTQVIQIHHELTHDGKVHTVAAAVALADSLAVQAGYCHGDEYDADEQPSLVGQRAANVHRAAAALHIDDSRLDRLREQAFHLANLVASAGQGAGA